MRHGRVYRMLKEAGHEPSKALEILVDARRGLSHALTWVRILHHAWQINRREG